MIYSNINVLKYLDKFDLLEDEFKEIYHNNYNINFLYEYKISTIIIDTYNLQNFIYFCNKNNIRWSSGDPAKRFFNHLIERGFISKTDSIIVTLYICQGDISMVYSTIAYRKDIKRFPKIIYDNLIEI